MANPRFKNFSLLALALVAAACAANPPPPAAPAPAPQETSSASASVDLPKIEQHLRDHQKYPATRADLLADCDNLKDFSANEKSWFAGHVGDGTYASADEVMVALRRTP
jgi:hypothetical protein